jgi:glutamate synthase (NADPH/NADH) small chain
VGGTVDAAALRRRHDALVVAIGAHSMRELPVPGRDLTGIHQAMEYLPLANRVCDGDLAASPVTAEGKDVVIVGGGDTGADCLGTVLRQRAASVVQLDINPRPGEDRAEHEPWPVYPKVYRVSPAHEEALELGGAGTDIRMFSASTLRFAGDAAGRVTALRLSEVEARGRTPLPGTERVIPAQLVLLALGFDGVERGGDLIGGLGIRLSARGTIARDADFAAGADGVFVAGDAGRGQSLVVWAIAEGRSAAAAVDRWLMGATELPVPISPQDRPLVV